MTPRTDIGQKSMATTSVLVVDGRKTRRSGLITDLSRRLGLVEGAGNASRAEQVLDRCRIDCLVIDLELSEPTASQWLDGLRRAGRSLPVIVTCEPDQVRKAVGLLRHGVAEIFMRPFEAASLVAAIQRARAGVAGASRLTTVPPGDVASAVSDAVLVGQSQPMAEVRRLVERVAPLPATVLIQGETGTGKELVARLLHRHSGRRGRFVPINCGAIAPELLESELFGHVKGAFTSAHQLREGLFVAARGGTLFLDEISEMPLGLEVKILRALEESAIRPVGSDREIKVDVRIVASTQHDLAERVRQGRFREDLYYRLNVIHIDLPPLRRRPEDVGDLATFFMSSLAGDLGMAPLAFDGGRIHEMRRYHWPGNVRELRNFVERALMLGEFPPEGLAETGPGDSPRARGYPEDWTLEQAKEAHMRRVLGACDGNRSAAARRLGISRKTLERKLGPRRDDH